MPTIPAVASGDIIDPIVFGNAVLDRLNSKFTNWLAAPNFNGNSGGVSLTYARWQETSAGRIYGEVKATMTGTPAGVGAFGFTLPFAPAAPAGVRLIIGAATLYDASGFYRSATLVADGTTARVDMAEGSGLMTYMVQNTPWAWATGDEVGAIFEYRPV